MQEVLDAKERDLCAQHAAEKQAWSREMSAKVGCGV